ncbi:MAG: oxidoreductase [Aeromicrobium sp.]|nr:oxidoreductase [Aeromicrobium sp.]
MTDVTNENFTVGVLGGTGAQGRGLALRWAASGLDVVLGSRDGERAEQAAAELNEELSEVDGAATVRGAGNRDASGLADIVLVAVPFDAHEKTLTDLVDVLDGKLVIDCVNPLGFDKQGAYVLDVDGGSAAEQAQALLPGSRVIGAFHNVSAVLLGDLSVTDVDTDVLVLGEDRDDVAVVQELADRIPGVRGVFGGRLRNAAQVEALTANLIAINRRHKTHAGIRITGQGL